MVSPKTERHKWGCRKPKLSRGGYRRRGWDGDGSEFLIFRVQVSHKCIGRYEGHCRYPGWTAALAAAAAAARSACRAVSAALPAKSGLRLAPDCGGGGAETEKAMTRVCPRGEGTRPGSLPRPRRDPQAETQQGRYATAPPHGPESKRLRAASRRRGT